MKPSAAPALISQPSLPGRIYYSNMIGKAAPGVSRKSLYVYQPAASQNRFFLVANAEVRENGRIVVFNAGGELLNSQEIKINKGKNTLEIAPGVLANAVPHLVAVYLDGQLAFMQKLS